jgi:glucokinase
MDGAVTMTNANLALDERGLSKELGRPARIANDLVAAAAGVAVGGVQAQIFRNSRCLRGYCFFASNRRVLRPDKPFWVVGLGTGVGASLVVPDKSGPTMIIAGEFGHSASSPWSFGLDRDEAMVSVEDRLSGNGFMEWARRWQAEGRITLPGGPWLSPEADARVVLARPHSEWAALREAYSRLLGVVLGDLAMAATVPGGIHVIGGFAQAMFPHVDMVEFEFGFCGSRRLKVSVENVDVSVVVDERNPALLGAVAIGQGRVVIGG